jgi:hypothetical protein
MHYISYMENNMLRDLFLLLTLFLVLGMVGCGGKGGGSGGSTTSVQPTTPPTSEEQLYCSDDPQCISQCHGLYPYQDPAAITAYYNSRGLLFSGAYQQALAQNAQLITQYNNCVSMPLN